MDDRTVFNQEAGATKPPVARSAARPDEDAGDIVPVTSTPAELPNQFVYEFENGRKILVEIDPATGKEHFLKNL